MVTNYTPIQGQVPEPSEFGLINSKTLALSEERWNGGIAIDSIVCNVSSRIFNNICSISSTSSAVSGTDKSSGPILVRPFTIQADYECSTFGFLNQDYFEKAALGLDLCQSKLVESEFWTGALAQQDDEIDSEGNATTNRYLASQDAVDITPTTGTAIKPAYALALLEEALATCGCGVKGYVHATRSVASVLPLKHEDDVLVTKLGNYVIAGTGYTGTGPTGTDPGNGKAWMYATGPVSVRLGDTYIVPDNINQATDIRNNSVSVSAEKEVAVTWDGCCHFAVLVDLSLDYS